MSNQPITHLFPDDGLLPNNEVLPLLIYLQAVTLPGADDAPSDAALASSVLDVFTANGWGNTWINGIFPYHHYHSIAHEVLGICRGRARVQLGGDVVGKTVEVQPGDVIVIPAGVAHKNLGCSDDFLVVGAYPPGQTWDLLRAEENVREEALANIERVPLPTTDPVFGKSGPLIEHWLAPDQPAA